MPPTGSAAILHADLDAFYASVEQLLDPGLRGRPIAVGGSVVLAASYEARRFGVRGAMPGWRARRLCPDLVFVPGQFDQYQRLGDQVMAVFSDFTPQVERISIDEAFMDVGGSVRLFGPPSVIAAAIRERVRTEIGLPLSVGVARTKHLAKIASQVAKPDGLVVVEPGEEQAFLDPLPVSLVWGIGPARQETLRRSGIHTIGQLAATGSDVLQHILGRADGARLGDLAANRDERQVQKRPAAKSVGAQSALGRQEATERLVRDTLTYLADRVTGRMRRADQAGRTITVRVRFPGLKSVTRSETLPSATSSTTEITELAIALAHAALADHQGERYITLLGLSVSGLDPAGAVQLSLPVTGDGPLRDRLTLDRSVDAVREKFGRAAVNYAGVRFAAGERVDEAFRELAEHHG